MRFNDIRRPHRCRAVANTVAISISATVLATAILYLATTSIFIVHCWLGYACKCKCSLCARLTTSSCILPVFVVAGLPSFPATTPVASNCELSSCNFWYLSFCGTPTVFIPLLRFTSQFKRPKCGYCVFGSPVYQLCVPAGCTSSGSKLPGCRFNL